MLFSSTATHHPNTVALLAALRDVRGGADGASPSQPLQPAVGEGAGRLQAASGAPGAGDRG